MWVFYVLFILFVLLLIFDMKKPNSFPPGPKWLPLVGSYLHFREIYKTTKLTHLVWEKLAQKYGSIVGVRMGLDKLIIVSGYKMAYEVLNREEFEGRPDGLFFRLRALGRRLGVAFVDGPVAHDQRRFCLQNLKEFGFGKSVMEQRILLEATELVSWLKKSSKDGPLRMECVFDISIINTLWAMLAGKRFNLDDDRLHEILNCIYEIFRLVDMSGGLLNQMPFLRYIAPEKSSYNKMVFLHDKMMSFLRDTIEEHKLTYEPDKTRDVVDAFIHEIEKRKGIADSIYTEDQLVVLLLDFFIAGSETTSRSLSFAMLYLLRNPQVQERAHLELDLIVGKGNQPTMQHRSSLIYMEAIAMEVQRFCSVAPMTAAHRAMTDAYVSGYRIPKDSIVLVSLYSVHMDKNHWGDPENFRPERFIDDNGKLIQDDYLMPFGSGKRRCIGESLAKGSIFLFLSTILHNFKISLPPDHKIPPLVYLDGATLTPLPFSAILSPRF